jgi:hypothetical protein
MAYAVGSYGSDFDLRTLDVNDHSVNSFAPETRVLRTDIRSLSPYSNEFECRRDKTGYKPFSLKSNKKLGRDPMSKSDCEKAIAASTDTIVCTSTGIGYKPTFYKGKTSSRMDFGFWGSSIKTLDACVKATQNATENEVCFWGGNYWAITSTDGKDRIRGSAKSLNDCLKILLKNRKPTVRDSLPPADRLPSTEPESLPPLTHEPPVNHAGSGHSYDQYCAHCHEQGNNAPKFEKWLLDKDALQKALENDETHEYAQTWFDKLKQALVTVGNMPPAGDRKSEQAEHDPKMQELKEFLSHDISRDASPRVEQTPSHVRVAANAVQVLSDRTLNAYRSMLPTVVDPRINAVLKDPNTIFYDDKTLPSAYQDASKPVVGVRSSSDGTQKSLIGRAPYLDRDGKLKTFSHGVGLDPKAKIRTYFFISLPKDKDGNLQKIDLTKNGRRRRGEDGNLWRWVFPVGTVSGEVVYATDSDGKSHVLEVRVRTKDKRRGAQKSDIFVATPSKQSLVDRLSDIETTHPDLGTEISRVRSELASSEIYPISLGNPGKYQLRGIDSKGATVHLPKMSEALAKVILDTPFKSSVGTIWDSQGRTVASAPTTSQSFGIVPQHSTRGALTVSRETCNQCHNLANEQISSLYPNRGKGLDETLRATTDLYGNLPGNDGNLRWHPFDPSRLKDFGVNGKPDNRQIWGKFRSIINM